MPAELDGCWCVFVEGRHSFSRRGCPAVIEYSFIRYGGVAQKICEWPKIRFFKTGDKIRGKIMLARNMRISTAVFFSNETVRPVLVAVATDTEKFGWVSVLRRFRH